MSWGFTVAPFPRLCNVYIPGFAVHVVFASIKKRTGSVDASQFSWFSTGYFVINFAGSQICTVCICMRNFFFFSLVTSTTCVSWCGRTDTRATPTWTTGINYLCILVRLDGYEGYSCLDYRYQLRVYPGVAGRIPGLLLPGLQVSTTCVSWCGWTDTRATPTWTTGIACYHCKKERKNACFLPKYLEN